MKYKEFVESRIKDPQEILDSLTPLKVNLDHMVKGVGGEAGELVDAIKKHVVYNKDLDVENVLEECGDLLFYITGMLSMLGFTLNDAMEHNKKKLTKRYPVEYTDNLAVERLDKQ